MVNNSIYRLNYSFPSYSTLVLDVQELKDNFLPGLPLPTNFTDENYSFYLKSATQELESILSMRFLKETITETHDFVLQDSAEWNFIKLYYPINTVQSIKGVLNGQVQVLYPVEWASYSRTSDNSVKTRIMNLVPVQGSQITSIGVFGSIMPSMSNLGKIPNYWEVMYETGYNPQDLPYDIKEGIGTLAASKILQLISDSLLAGGLKQTVTSSGGVILSPQGESFVGLGLGVSSKSISLDGLNQSFSSYTNGLTGIWGARLKQYADLLDASKKSSLIARLIDKYNSMPFGVF